MTVDLVVIFILVSGLLVVDVIGGIQRQKYAVDIAITMHSTVLYLT